ASAAAAFRRLCSPGTSRSSSTGASSHPRTTSGTCASQPSKSAATSASDANSEWWSRPRLVTTAMRGRSAATERSDSSPSTTSHPPPAPAFAPSCGTSPPTIQLGSPPVSRRAKAIIAAVVVFPCAPATTIDSRRETSSASSSARGRPATDGYALETNTSHPAGTSGSGETRTSSPAARTAARYGVSFRSQPPTSAPHASASSPYADSPAPPMPTSQIRRPASGLSARKRDQLLGDLVRRVRLRGPQHRLPHRREPRVVREQLSDHPRDACDLGFSDDDRPARRLEVARVLRLVVGGHVRRRDEHGRLPRRRDLPDGAAGTTEDEVRRRERAREVVGPGQEPVVRPQPPSGELLRVALAAEVQHGGPRRAEGVDRQLVQHPRAERAAGDEEHAALRREAEPRAGLGGRDGLHRRDGAADDPVLRS